MNRVRELVGAMDEKRAGKGILVTTSWFASGCWTKSAENGKVELIDGTGSDGFASNTSTTMCSSPRPSAVPPSGVRRRQLPVHRAGDRESHH